tara:strand:- start:3086 stop:4225 length:1140 start_codon:yes stop_codon:yes gene_type:complete
VKYFNILLILLTLIALNSCSSFSWNEFFSGGGNAEKRNEKLMKDFEVDEDLAAKFEVKQVPVPPAPVRPTSKAVQEALNMPGQLISKPKRQTIKPKPSKKPLVKESKKTEAKKAKVKEEEQVATSPYPEDFPKRLIDFDKDSAKFWDDFEPVVNIGETTVLNITYLGVNTGKVTLTTKPHGLVGEDAVYHFNARVKTSSYYSYLYEVDDYCDSLVRQVDFLPRKFSLIQRESNHNIDDLQLFDLEKLQTISLYKKVSKKKTRKKKKIKPIPKYFQDPLSILHFLRGLPLEKAASYRIPLTNQGEVDEFFVKTGRTDKIKTEIGEKDAFVLEIETKAKGKTIKGGSMTFWFSADKNRVFLKFEAEIKIGSVQGEIEKYSL